MHNDVKYSFRRFAPVRKFRLVRTNFCDRSNEGSHFVPGNVDWCRLAREQEALQLIFKLRGMSDLDCAIANIGFQIANNLFFFIGPHQPLPT